MKIEQLIHLVYSKKPLWDQKDKKHHNRFILDRLWSEVAVEMNSTSKDVRLKWKSLRDKFRMELRKMAQLEAGYDGDECGSDWQYFEQMLFLRDQFIARKSQGCLDSSSLDPLEEEPEHKFYNNLISEAANNHIDESFTNFSTSKRIKDDYSDEWIELEKKKVKLMEEDAESKNDSNLDFYKSMLPHIKKLSDQQQMLLQMDIQKLIYSYVYGTTIETKL